MLTCKGVTEKATHYIDKELSWTQSMSMALHLLICGKCRRFVQYFRLSVVTLWGKKTLTQSEAEQMGAEIIKKSLSRSE